MALPEKIGGGSEVNYHTPVLLQDILQFLDPGPGKLFIDATVGGGGHTLALLKRGAKVLGIDRDPEAIEYIKNQFQISNFKFQIGQDLILVHANFNRIGDIAVKYGFTKTDGILFDLGVSSHQLATARRGFSFAKEGPLDMRMDPASQEVTASDIVNHFDKRRLNEIFKTFADEKFSWAIAGAICRARQIKPISSTTDLSRIIQEVYRVKERLPVAKIHPATRTFQALRIVVNSELLNLKEVLPQTVELLKQSGRLAIVSYHSLEDGQVKRFFKQTERLRVLTKKPIGPSSGEVLQNPRSRSAKLRVAEKL